MLNLNKLLDKSDNDWAQAELKNELGKKAGVRIAEAIRGLSELPKAATDEVATEENP